MEARDFIVDLLNRGWTQEQIAARTGIQQPTVSKLARGLAQDVLSANYLKLQALHVEENKRALDAYKAQRARAKVRRLAFTLTFEQWLKIWVESGHFMNRGRGAGKYCMSRFGDLGGYEIGNVHIQPCVENSREAAPGAASKLAAEKASVRAEIGPTLSLDDVLSKAGGKRELAYLLGISVQAVTKWTELPVNRLLQLRELRPRWFRKAAKK